MSAVKRSIQKTSIRDSASTITSNRLKPVLVKQGNKKKIRREFDLKVIFDNEDVTPRTLNSIAMYNNISGRDKRTYSQIDTKLEGGGGIFSTLASNISLQSQLHSINASGIIPRTSGSSIKTDDESSETIVSWLGEVEQTENKEDSTVPCKVEKAPQRFRIMLTETPLIYIFSMVSESEFRETDIGKNIEAENDSYDYLTIGKGRNRKMTTEEIQTNEYVVRYATTQANRYKSNSNFSFASEWDMLDTYNGVSEIDQTKTIPKTFEMTLTEDKMNDELVKLLHNPRFQYSFTVMERMLANNNYYIQQKRFRGMIEQDPFRPDIVFKYDLDLLWTFKNTIVAGYSVTSMHWNPKNTDIVAVGYGKFLYDEQKQGIMFCWNIKNPTQPEREFYYPEPVTSVAFSTLESNILAVGFYDGHVTILDITHRNVKTVAMTVQNFNPAHEPIWQVNWLDPDDYYPREEYLMCIGQNGKIHRLVPGKTGDLVPSNMMLTLPIEGKLKGVYQTRYCPVTDVPLKKCAAAFVITKHPTDNDIYYVGTDEGTLHKCCRHFINQHTDMILAHSGPIYSCQFSPFSDKLFLTCGADGNTNIWTDSIDKPLISLLNTSVEAVECATWSPANSTIIVNTIGSQIVFWDLQRRTYLPVVVHTSPTNCRNTIVQFTPSGKNLVVGDVDGNVHILALIDMPFPPFYQTEMLFEVLKKTLSSEPDIVNKVGCQV